MKAEADEGSRSEPGARAWLFRYTPHLVFAFIFFAWTVAWLIAFRTEALKSVTSQPLNDIFLSVNTLFAGLAFFGIIWTSVTQYLDQKESKKLIRETAAANSKLADHADEKAVLDLFQTYCSEYFQSVKNRSMNVLIASVRSSQYGAYVVSRFSVAGQKPLPPKSCFEMLGKIDSWDNWDKFEKIELHDRYKLDELINFFSLLVGMSNAKDVIKGCDFSYAWWRPLLWMLATQLEHLYYADPEVRKYSVGRNLNRVVKGLDKIYDCQPFANAQEAWIYIIGHPKIKAYGLDPEYLRIQSALDAGPWPDRPVNEDDLFTVVQGSPGVDGGVSRAMAA